MAITRVNKVDEGRRQKKFKQRFKDEVVMLVVGAEDGVVLAHQGPDGAMTISGENTAGDLRGIGVNVEDWVDRKLIAPLGVLAIPVQVETRNDQMFTDVPDGEEDIAGFEDEESDDEESDEEESDEEESDEESEEEESEESEVEEEEEKPVKPAGRARRVAR